MPVRLIDTIFTRVETPETCVVKGKNGWNKTV